MPESRDPLADLLIDAADLDRTRIAAALKGLVGINADDGRIVPLPGFRELKNRDRVSAILLAAKAAHLMGLADSEAIAPKDVPRLAGIPEGSAAPVLKELRDGTEVSQTDSQQYYLGDHGVLRAVEAIEVARAGRGSDASQGGVSSRGAPGAKRKTKTASKAKTTAKAKGGATAASKGKEQPAAGRRRGSRGSAMAVVRNQIKRGWFKKARTLPDLVEHLKVKATPFKVTSLSPVLYRLARAGELDRTPGEDGVYVYTAPVSE